MYASMAAQLVSPDTILMTPDTAPIPEDPGALYAVTTALSSRANAGTIDRIITYLRRMMPEFQIYCIKSALATQQGRMSKLGPEERKKTRMIEHTHAFVTFAAEHNDILS